MRHFCVNFHAKRPKSKRLTPIKMARRKNIQPQQHKRVITQKAEVEHYKGATITPSALASPRCLTCAAFCYPLRLNGGHLAQELPKAQRGN